MLEAKKPIACCFFRNTGFGRAKNKAAKPRCESSGYKVTQYWEISWKVQHIGSNDSRYKSQHNKSKARFRYLSSLSPL